MSAMRIRRAGWGLGLAVMVQVIAGCGSSTPTSAMTAAELTQRELSSKTVPAGFQIDVLPPESGGSMSDDAAASDSASPQATPVGRIPCNALQDAIGFVADDEPAAGKSKDSVLLTATALYGMKWLGSENLFGYPGNGATQVLADVRQIAARCAKTNIGDADISTFVTSVDGPKLGDESLLVKVRSTSTMGGLSVATSSDAMFVRIGGTLILLTENSTPTPSDGGSPQLEALAPAAVAAFNAAGTGH